MSKFSEWEATRSILKTAKSWIENRSKIDSQDGKHYTKVPLQAVKLEYCGQSYAGANNYHESPPKFNTYIAIAVNEMRVEIEDRALVLLSDENNKRALAATGEVEAMMQEINNSNAD